MVRRKPCQYCKQRRRKCERTDDHSPCVRCNHLRKVCVPHVDTEYDEQSDMEDNQLMESMRLQVEELENELQQLELITQNKDKKEEEYRWDIEIVGDQIVLKSEITSIEELMMYGQSVMRYLSPFGSTFKSTSLVFERVRPSLISVAIRLVKKLNQQDHPNIIDLSLVNRLRQEEQDMLTQRLLENHFECTNLTMPMLHKPSFYKYYNRLEKPLDDAMTLAICVCSSIVSCKHAFLRPQDRRYVGEYYYARCMSLLMEMFDEEGKELPTLIVINMVLSFMTMTLRMKETKRWTSIAVMVASGLRNDHPQMAHQKDCKDMETRVHYAIMHRNVMMAEFVSFSVEFISNARVDFPLKTHEAFDILPDEPEYTKTMVDLLNHHLQLLNRSPSRRMCMQAHYLAAGELAELNLEDIMTYHQDTVVWWRELPDNLKLTKEPFTCTKEIIQESTDTTKLMMSLYLHILTMELQECFIQLKTTADINVVSQILQEKAVCMILHLAEMVVLTIHRLKEISPYCCEVSRFLIRSIDSIIAVIENNNHFTSTQARARVVEYIQEIKRLIPLDHQMPDKDLPYLKTFLSSSGNLIDHYVQFPLPAEALCYDIITVCVHESTRIV